MSYDDQYAEAAEEEFIRELYVAHKEQAIEEFTQERLQSYYVAHGDIAADASRTLEIARMLLPVYAPAALVFATTSIEVAMKTAILKPIVAGLVHSDPVAEYIAKTVLSQKPDQFQGLLFFILAEHTEIDLKTFARTGQTKTLWQEILEIQKLRNGIVHRADTATSEQAQLAIDVATALIETEVFPTVVKNLGLHLHEPLRPCGDYECRFSNPEHV